MLDDVAMSAATTEDAVSEKTKAILKIGDRITWGHLGAGTISLPFVLREEDGQMMCQSDEHEGVTYPLWTVKFDKGGEKIACCQHGMEKIDEG
jgi:hypothetical protein